MTLLDLFPVQDRFIVAKAFIEVACGFRPDVDAIVRRVQINLAWDNYWAEDEKQQMWLETIQGNLPLAYDLAQRVLFWLDLPKLSQRQAMIDDLRV